MLAVVAVGPCSPCMCDLEIGACCDCRPTRSAHFWSALNSGLGEPVSCIFRRVWM